MDGGIVQLVCKAFTIQASSITEAVEKWNRVKHSAAHSYEDLQILSIDGVKPVKDAYQNASDYEKWLRAELDRLGPHVRCEASVVEVKTIERVLAKYKRFVP